MKALEFQDTTVNVDYAIFLSKTSHGISSYPKIYIKVLLSNVVNTGEAFPAKLLPTVSTPGILCGSSRYFLLILFDVVAKINV